MSIKTINSVYKDIIVILNKALEVMGIQGWDIIQLFQQTKDVPINPTLFIQANNFKNEGWQFFKNEVVENEIKHTEQFIVQFDLKLSAFRRKDITDTENTINGIDLLENIKTFLLSQQGIQYIRSLGYNIYNPQQLNIVDFVNDSDNFELLPTLLINFTFNQKWTSNQGTIEEFKFIINKV